MTDYTKNEDYAAKDALAPADPEKLILGTDIGPEFDEIQVAIASKFDTSDIASQAQAQAGTNNTTLMTPLRVAELLGISGSAGGTAQALPDILSLNDPGDDRILVWDESADVITWLDIGAHLEMTAGLVLNVTEATLDHDALVNFVADEHIAHASVQPLASTGLTITGTNIAADFTYGLDLNALTTETVLDPAVDFIPFRDTSAGADRKVLLSAMIGSALGDGKWYRSTDQSITTSLATFIYNTAVYDSLEKGTFNTVTGEYTVGAAAARIQISALHFIASHGEAEDATIEIQVNGVRQAQAFVTNRGQYGLSGSTLRVSTTLSLSAADVVRVQTVNDGARTLPGGIHRQNVSIVELA